MYSRARTSGLIPLRQGARANQIPYTLNSKQILNFRCVKHVARLIQLIRNEQAYDVALKFPTLGFDRIYSVLESHDRVNRPRTVTRIGKVVFDQEC